MLEIAIMGFGVVGSGVAEVLTKNANSIKKKANSEIMISKILDLRDFSDHVLADKFTKSADDIIKSDTIQIVVETMGGLHPAFEFVSKSLESGKSVVTSNKELVSVKGDELLAIAAKNNVNFLFEASVGGGIPILRPLDQCLAANEVHQIVGILNGTTNYILDKMIRTEISFEDALKQAQDLGYSEHDPSADIDGIDTCRKISILGSLAFGYHVDPDKISTEGIRSVTLDDVKYAQSWGGTIKLLGYIHRNDNGTLDSFVAPMFVSGDSMLSDINGVFNGILVRGDAIGDVIFYGKGAGKLPTASAVVADIIDIANHLGSRKRIFWQSEKAKSLNDSSAFKSQWFLRLNAQSLNLGEISSTLSVTPFSYEVIKNPASSKDEIGLVTSELSKNDIEKITEAMPKSALISKYRVADATTAE